ncbi:MAG: hypothetical protein NT104_03140 [Bacteroidetes bacterium]|nr:hypothetical protein [Bacteroidota bacterium]
MRLKLAFLLCLLLGLMAQTSLYAKHKARTKKKANHAIVHKKSIAHHSTKKGKKHKARKYMAKEPRDKAPSEMIAQNKEKLRLSDSVHNSYIQLDNKEVEEGYFAGLFSKQKKIASFETLEGTASVFKSVSGWEDKKFYILTNQLPIGTIVRITTADFKSICAKVISSLPDVSNSIQYRLSDAAAAILGITNKTFKISVTY